VAAYLHDPGDPRDGLSVAVPLFALNQVSEARCEWLVPGMLKDKVLALLKTLPQRPRSRLVPLPQTAERMAAALGAPERFGQGSLIDALLAMVREATQLPVQRTDFKPDMLQPHHFMHLRVVYEHGRLLGQGRHLAALKAELGSKARGAFQALAQLKLKDVAGGGEAATPPSPIPAKAGRDGDARPRRSAPAPAPAPAASADQRHTAWDLVSCPS
jgi:ATP-dependent helicase HrpA